jgi:hypothetical protein
MPKLLLYGQTEQVASLFSSLLQKKKVLKCLRLDNLHSVERKKKYLEGFSQEIRSLNAKKVFFFFFFPSSQVFVRNESI